MTSISVLLPAYNRESTIRVSLDALLAQSHRDWEAIVVDDGSSDGTYEIVAGYAERDARIRVERQANAGVSAARNRALALARHPWLFFLDADDWISPDAFSLLVRALELNPGADAAQGGCMRVLPDGTEVAEPPPPPVDELFVTFAHTCAFSIHTCLIRTDLVRAVGGFDESLVTCEDWDLWQRVVRTGAQFVTIPDYVAYYRIRTTSASRDGVRLLSDGLLVIERGHGNDPRLADWPGPLHAGRRPELESGARLYLAAYAAGLRLAAGGDARELLDLVPDGAPGDVDGDGVADTVFFSIIEARAATPADWASFPPEIQTSLIAFIDAMGAKTHDNWLPFVATGTLERLIVEHAGVDAALMIGGTQLSPVTVGVAIAHIEVQPGARRLLLSVAERDEHVGSVLVPAGDGVMPAPVVADAVADELAWDLLERFFARTIYPSLRVSRSATQLTVHRGDVAMSDVETPQAETAPRSIHRHAGWTAFLQEVWGLPNWETERFYRAKRGAARERSSKTLDAGGAPLVVEVSEELPQIVGAHGALAVQVTLAGVPFMVVRVHPARGRVDPGALRRAITVAGRYELCRLAVREGLLGRWSDEVPLRARLAAVAERRRREGAASEPPAGAPPGSELWLPLLEEAVPAGRRAVIIGRRARGSLAGSINRTASIPLAAIDVIIEAARGAGQPVFEFGDGAHADIALYAPFVFDPSRVPIEAGGAPLKRSVRMAARRRATRARRSVSVRRRARVGVPDLGPGVAATVLPHGPRHHVEADVSSTFTDRLPILMYHRVSEDKRGPYRRWSVTPGELEEQLAFLRQAGFRSLSIEEWAEAGANDRPVPGRPVMLTFDDGYADFAEEVVPLLQRYGFRAEVFVVTGHVGTTNDWETGRSETDPLMDWSTLAELPQDIVRIGSHTHSHQMLPALSSEDALRELVTSKVMLEDRLGRPVTSVAYPYGPADGAVQRLSAAAGYDYAYTTLHWWAFLGRDLLKLPRLEVRGGQSIEAFAATVGAPS